MSQETDEDPLHDRRRSNREQKFMWMSPTGGQVMLHGSASDHHALNNAVSEFRKAGLSV